MPNIVVVGAGVSGLTTALLLSKNPDYKVTIVAKHMPGDYDIEYTSPWAGANYLPVSSKEGSRWERNTWPELARLAKDVPEAGIHFQDAIIYNRLADHTGPTGQWFNELLSPTPWFASVKPDNNFQILAPSTLPPGIDSGTRFTSVCINTAIYLPYLLSLCIKNGSVVKRAVLSHINDAAGLHHSGTKADLVVNCTGLLAATLGGVMDETVVPVRGQIVVVRNSPGAMYTVSGTDDGAEEVSYIMERAAGGGTILGGTYQKGRTDPNPDPETAERIMRRAIELCPQLVPEGQGIEALDVVRHGVGLRPVREGGVRIEKERIGGVWVVHNYGHGGWGYQGSYGCSEGVVGLVDEVLGGKGVKAKL